jgi:hypothetical protein
MNTAYKYLYFRWLCIFICMIPAAAPAATGTVTWVHPAAGENGLRVESAVAGPSAMLQAADGSEIRTTEQLAAAGWQVAADGLWETPPRAGGGRLTLTVRGLPVGTHRVFLRFFSQPRVPGNEWWYTTRAGLGDAGEQSLDYHAGVVIQGTGGHDPKTIYEAALGELGSEASPVGTVSLWFQRYEWSQVSRVGSIRIETLPALSYAHTQEQSPENDAVREALLAAGADTAAAALPYGLAVVSGTLKVRPTRFDDLRNRFLGKEIEMEACRGEYESRQVLVYSPNQALADVHLEASPLRGPQGATIPVSELLFAPVGYCPYAVPEDLAVHGYWPDPILTFLASFTIRQHDVQALWFRVHVPPGTPPGEYRGSVTVRPANAPAGTVAVRLTVWDLDTPLMSHLRVVVGCNRSDAFEMSYKLNPSSIYGFDQEWLGRLGDWARGGATAINLGYIYGAQIKSADHLPSADQIQGWLREVGERLAAATQAGLRQSCYLYLFDEAGAEWTPAMQQIAAAFKQSYPDLPLLTTAHRAWYAEGSVRDGGETIAGIDWWCPLLFHYDLAQAEAARRHGKQVWWYTCNSPNKPFPNVLMTHPLMDIRLLMGFMAFAYKTDGFLYYATSGGPYVSLPAIESGPYTTWPIEDNAHNHLYQKGPAGPLPSLRLEALRDGLEDYDLLYAAAGLLAARRGGVAVASDVAVSEAEVASWFAPGNPLVRSLTDYSDDPVALEAARRRLAQYCVAARRTPGKAPETP